MVGAGPVGGTLACRLAAAGISTVVVDRAALPPMEHPAFDGRAYAIAAGSRRPAGGRGRVGPAAGAGLPDPGHPGQRRPLGRRASPLFLHFDHREAGEHPAAVRLDGGGTQPARGAERPHACAARAARVRACRGRRWNGARTAPSVQIAGGPRIDVPAGGGGRGPQFAAARGGRHSGHPLPYSQTGIVCAISHAKPHNNTALEHFLPSGPFAQLPMCASPDAEEGGAANVSAIVWTERTPIAQRMLTLDDARLSREIARRLGDHLGEVHVHRPPLELSALGACTRTATSNAPGAGGRCGARRSIRSPARDSISAFAM